MGWKGTEGVGKVERHKVEKSRERRDKKREVGEYQTERKMNFLDDTHLP